MQTNSPIIPSALHNIKGKISTSHRNIIAKPAGPIDWQDFVYQYWADVDILKLHFVATPHLITHSESYGDESYVLDYNEAEKIVAIEIFNCSRTLPCQLSEAHNNDPSTADPFVLSCVYSPDVDYLKVYFVKQEDIRGLYSESEELTPSIVLDKDSDGHVIAIEFANASTLLVNN